MLGLVYLFSIVLCSTHAFHLRSPLVDRRSCQLHMSSDGKRTPLIAANWKMNPVSRAKAASLTESVVHLTRGASNVDVVLFPPAPFLSIVAERIVDSHVQLGGQNCLFEPSGPFTGEVSIGMVKDFGASYVICGHSERRLMFGEEDEIVNMKVKQVLAEGLRPILCIGENEDQNDEGMNRETCAEQLTLGLKNVTLEEFPRVVIAYEPVWAISTGKVCPATQAQAMCAFVRSRVAGMYGRSVAEKCVIQYGGGVTGDNIKRLMSKPDIDGVLVGGASLVPESFAEIVNYAM